MFHRLLIAVTLSCVVATGHAASLLRDVIYTNEQEVVRVDIQMGITGEVEGSRLENNERRLVLNIPAQVGGDREWSSMRVVFDEADRYLTSVEMEGSGSKGYEVRVDFSERVAVTVLPQFRSQMLAFKFAPARWLKKQTRFRQPESVDPFVVVLETRNIQLPTLGDIPQRFAVDHSVYMLEKASANSQQLRLGFFQNADDAKRVATALRREFPETSILKVSQAEVQYGNWFRLNPPDLVVEPSSAAADIVAASDAPGLSGSTLDQEVSLSIRSITPSALESAPEPTPPPMDPLWQRRRAAEPEGVDLTLREARKALAAEDFDLAIRLYSKALEESNASQRLEALEYLGVAREMNGQEAHARRIYELYLSEQDEGEPADRVRQRLAVLVALDMTPSEPNRGRRVASRSEGWQLAGQFGQFYRRHTLEVDGNSSVPINGLFNDLNLLARNRGGGLEQEARISMSYLADFSGDLNGREFQVGTLAWEGYLNRTNTGLVVGRQTRSDSGVLGRFDGVSLTQRLWEPATLVLTGGYIVESTFDAPESDRPFFGIGGEFVSESGNLVLEPFFIQQYVDDDIIDRQAIGAQGQWRGDRGMMFTLIDYDLHHSVLNNFTLSGDTNLRNTRVFASFEHRRSPYLTTRNALIGQPLESLSELELLLQDLDLDDIAADRTAKNTTLRFGLNQTLSERWSVTADVVGSDYSETEASANVLGIESNQTLYSSLQLRSTDPFGAASYSSMTLRRADSGTSTTTSLFMDNRISLGDSWRIYPRMRVDYRSIDRNGDTQWSARPSLRLDYRRGRGLQMEFEAGYDWTRREMSTRDLDITGTYVRAGYRAVF